MITIDIRLWLDKSRGHNAAMGKQRELTDALIDSDDRIRRCGTIDYEFFEWLAELEADPLAAQDDDKPPIQAT
jgi:hypothetical protein